MSMYETLSNGIKRLRPSAIATERIKILAAQNYQCAICEIDLNGFKAVLDHDHVTGYIRGVLCNNCNGIEGKVFNLARRAKRDGTPEAWLNKMIAYRLGPQHDVLHPTHLTEEEKRLRRNKKARERRHASKGND